MTSTETRRDTAVGAYATAATAAVVLIATIQIAVGSARGQRWDDWSMSTVVAGRDTQLTLLSVLGYISIGALVLVAVGCVLTALMRGRAALAIGAAVVLGGANVTTQLLKHVVLDRPDLGLGTLNSLPSGHTTVVASAVGAALLVVPSVLRPVVAAAGGFAATLTGASTVVAGWHRPSDVVAALAVSLMWTAGVAAVIHGPRRRAAGTALSSVAGCSAGLAFLVAIGVRPAYGWVGFTQAALVLGAVTVITSMYVVAASAVSSAD